MNGRKDDEVVPDRPTIPQCEGPEVTETEGPIEEAAPGIRPGYGAE
jgi:hypothetical protein